MSKALGRETIASLVVSVGITAGVAVLAQGTEDAEATVQALGGNVRFTTDGTAPVAATTGHKLAQDGIVTLYGYEEISAARFINDGGTATLEVTITDKTA